MCGSFREPGFVITVWLPHVFDLGLCDKEDRLLKGGLNTGEFRREQEARDALHIRFPNTVESTFQKIKL